MRLPTRRRIDHLAWFSGGLLLVAGACGGASKARDGGVPADTATAPAATGGRSGAPGAGGAGGATARDIPDAFVVGSGGRPGSGGSASTGGRTSAGGTGGRGAGGDTIPGLTMLAADQIRPVRVAVDATSVYWANAFGTTVMKLTPK